MEHLDAKEASSENSLYWNELCGTGAAQTLGIHDDSAESLKKFDDWYLNFYPYLLKHVPLKEMMGKDVLDVGLGYGTLGAQLAGSGCKSYTGLDIAVNPVRMLNHRASLMGISHKAKAVQGDILSPPFAPESFDAFVAIGALHHTGDIERSIQVAHRLLRPGGTAYIMVYNARSYRQWQKWPVVTFKNFIKESLGNYGDKGSTEAQRKAYDAHIESGVAAPHTEFLSIFRLKKIFSNFSNVSFTKENCDTFVARGRIIFERSSLLGSLGRYAGLDIYIKAIK